MTNFNRKLFRAKALGSTRKALFSEDLLLGEIDLTWDLGEHLEAEDVSPTPLGDSKGVIVALGVPEPISRELSVSSGLPPCEMHVTLAYLEAPDTELLDSILKEFTEQECCFDVNLGGIGRFLQDTQDVFYVSVDSNELTEKRQRLVEKLENAGVEVSKLHGFTPHITIKYMAKDEITPCFKVGLIESLSWTVSKIELWDNNLTTSYCFADDY